MHRCLHERVKKYAVWMLFFPFPCTAAVGVTHSTSLCYMHRASHRAPSMHRVHLVKLMHHCRSHARGRGRAPINCFHSSCNERIRMVVRALQAKCTPISRTPNASASTHGACICLACAFACVQNYLHAMYRSWVKIQ
jgi:hypothetical protein